MPSPILEELLPSELSKNSVGVLILKGQQLGAECTVEIGGQGVPIKYADATSLHIRVGLEVTNTEGSKRVVARNIAGEISNELFLNVVASPIALSSSGHPFASVRTGPPSLDFPSVKPKSPIEKGQLLNKLFSLWGDGSTPFRPYIILDCVDPSEDVLHDVAGDAQGSQNQDPVQYVPFPGSRWGVFFKYIKPLISEPISNPVFSADPSLAVFVVTSGFGSPVSYGSARVIGSSFMAGLITRLVLHQYSKAWEKAGKPPIELDLKLNSFGLVESITAFSKLQSSPGTWHRDDKFWKDKVWPVPTATSSFSEIDALMRDGCSCQATAMVLGWTAADSLFKVDAAIQDELIKTLWKIIGTRYTTFNIGIAVSYTLNYLIGFLRSRRTQAILNNTPVPTPNGPATPLTEVFKQVALYSSTDQATDPVSPLLTRLFQMITDEFYAIGNSSIPQTEKTFRLTEYRAFINGFQRGNLLAADHVFREAFGCGYSVGFTKGFRDGYAQGYAAGYQAGYKAGYDDAKEVWSSFQGILKSLTDSSGDVKTFLQNAQAAGTAIVAIAAFF